MKKLLLALIAIIGPITAAEANCWPNDWFCNFQERSREQHQQFFDDVNRERQQRDDANAIADEVERRLDARARETSRGAEPVTGSADVADPIAHPQTQKYIAELQRQAQYDPALPRKTCEYQHSLLATQMADTLFIWACFSEGHLKLDTERMNADVKQSTDAIQKAAKGDSARARTLCANHAAQPNPDGTYLIACIRAGHLTADEATPAKK